MRETRYDTPRHMHAEVGGSHQPTYLLVVYCVPQGEKFIAHMGRHFQSRPWVALTLLRIQSRTRERWLTTLGLWVFTFGFCKVHYWSRAGASSGRGRCGRRHLKHRLELWHRSLANKEHGATQAVSSTGNEVNKAACQASMRG